jgi:hypothetical protein
MHDLPLHAKTNFTAPGRSFESNESAWKRPVAAKVQVIGFCIRVGQHEAAPLNASSHAARPYDGRLPIPWFGRRLILPEDWQQRNGEQQNTPCPVVSHYVRPRVSKKSQQPVFLGL